MTNSDRDRLLDVLGALPAATPTAASAERLRARCHAALESQHATEPIHQRESRWAPGLLFCGVSLLYLSCGARSSTEDPPAH